MCSTLATSTGSWTGRAWPCSITRTSTSTFHSCGASSPRPKTSSSPAGRNWSRRCAPRASRASASGKRRTTMSNTTDDKAAASTAAALAEMREFGEEPSRIGGERCAELQALVRRQLELLGEDPDRAGLLKTPLRVSRSLSWLTRGYGQDVGEIVGDAVFEEEH